MVLLTGNSGVRDSLAFLSALSLYSLISPFISLSLSYSHSLSLKRTGRNLLISAHCSRPPFSLSKTPDSFVLDLCVLLCLGLLLFVCACVMCVCVSARVCVCHSGVWTLTFLCFDNHRALCPSVPPAMTQGNVTCQSPTPTYKALSSLTPLRTCTNPTALRPAHAETPPPPPSRSDPSRSCPGPHLGRGDKKPLAYSLPLLTPFVFLPTTSYDSVSLCSFAALYPNGSPTAAPSSLPTAPSYHFAPRTLGYGTGRQNISSTGGGKSAVGS